VVEYDRVYLPDVADEVRQLERLGEGAGVGPRFLGALRVHHREHHVRDRDRGAAQVRFEVGVGVVVLAIDVPKHGVDELVYLAVGHVVFVGDATEGRQDGVVARSVTKCDGANPLEFPALCRRRARVGVVDDVVGHPEERVEDVRGVANSPREESRREVERRPRPALDGLALRDRIPAGLRRRVSVGGRGFRRVAHYFV
jgi:hypothetical protein